MRQVPRSDRPREKLARVGVEALGDTELLALLLGSGTRARGALSVAQDVLNTAGGAHGLVVQGVADLCRVHGLGPSRAACIVAAVELGRRALVADGTERLRIRRPADAAGYLMPRYAGYRVERCGVMLLDVKQRVTRTVLLSVGSIDSSPAHPREVFREAVVGSAASVVLFHNHPSGDPTPSMDDRVATERLHAAGEVLGIELVDHIILGDGRYFSFKEEAYR